jgi:hypothetical protein
VEGTRVVHPTIGGRAMLHFLEKAKLYLWAFVEIGFLTVLSIILVHLILGADSGVFVTSVADNVLKFANGVPPQSMVGIAIVLALVFLIANRMKT